MVVEMIEMGGFVFPLVKKNKIYIFFPNFNFDIYTN